MIALKKNPLAGFLVAQAALLAGIFLASPASAGHHGEMKAKQGDVVEVAVAAGDFTTLAAALEAAGLVDTLQGEGPFTVFAPTDAAFAKLPAGTVETLLKPENKDQLIAILTYHVVSGEVTAAQVVTLESAETVNGKTVAIAADDNGVRVNQANVTATDIEASNGVIHVIDEVLLPPAS
ncbi:MAG: fasciclin domain-containing protein [Gammaproteobacteria bacterium]